MESFTTTVPFSGFYQSFHSEMIATCEEQMFSDNKGNVYNELAEDFFYHVDYAEVHKKYAEAFVKSFSKEFEISLEFDELVSPKYYNFETDRIFVKISRSDIVKMLWKVKGKYLNNKAKQLFTSRPGFASFYSSNPRDWGKISTWDHNQIGAILRAYVDYNCADWCYTEESLVSDFNCNGDLDEWIFSSTDRDGKLAISFASILRETYA
jgi:hypothetical protein